MSRTDKKSFFAKMIWTLKMAIAIMRYMNEIQLLTLHGLVAMAVIQDIMQTRISNRLIVSGLGISMLLRIISGEAEQIYRILPNILFPVIVLYLFYLMGAIGAGDIKLFSLIGSFIDLKTLLCCIIISFICGAILSFGKMVYRGELFYRTRNGLLYIFSLFRGDLARYEERSEDNIIHFSIAIMIGLVISEIYISEIYRFL